MYLVFVILIGVQLGYFYNNYQFLIGLIVYATILQMIEVVQMPGTVRNFIGNKISYLDFVNVIEFIFYSVYIYTKVVQVN